jgi:hypothetical protein
MRRYRVGFILGCGLAVAGGAVAAAAVARDSFHGVSVLAAESLEKSNDKGEVETATVTVGPYAENAVVLYEANSRARFALTKADQVKLTGLRSTVLVDGASTDSRLQSGYIGGDHAFSLGAEYGQQKLFLKQGEVKTLAVVTERVGDLDAARTSIASRLHIVAIAAPN